MIYWKDFKFDDFLGPILTFRESDVCQTSVQEDAKTGAATQETRRTQQPARMVGLIDLENVVVSCDGMEAVRADRHATRKPEGEL